LFLFFFALVLGAHFVSKAHLDVRSRLGHTKEFLQALLLRRLSANSVIFTEEDSLRAVLSIFLFSFLDELLQGLHRDRVYFAQSDFLGDFLAESCT